MPHILFAVGAGILLGLLTGILPGIHVNLVAAVLLSQQLLLQSTGLGSAAACFLLCLGITQGIVDILPTVFMGAVDEESCVSALPGMELMQRGFGLEAVRLWLQGCLLGALLSFLLSPILIFALPHLFTALKPFTGFVLLWIAGKMVWSGFRLKTASNLCIFLLSGLLGVIAFTQRGLSEPVFPLMSGLFGCASLLMTSSASGQLPKQQTRPVITLIRKTWISVSAAAFLASMIQALFPGIGRSQSSAIGLGVVGELPSAASIALLGMISTMGSIVSIISLVTIGKSRDGAIIIIGELVRADRSSLLFFLALILLTAGIASLLTLLLARKLIPVLERLPRKLLAYSVLLLIAFLVRLLSGFQGLLVLGTATALGVLCERMEVKRRMLLGSLLIPVLSYWFL